MVSGASNAMRRNPAYVNVGHVAIITVGLILSVRFALAAFKAWGPTRDLGKIPIHFCKAKRRRTCTINHMLMAGFGLQEISHRDPKLTPQSIFGGHRDYPSRQ
jgi:hypothetical protein